MQPRFVQRTKKRAFRLLEHPRFRAAYDFLLLRADETPELAELATWWTEAQELGHDRLAEKLAVVPAASLDETVPAKRKRPRRRRRKGKSAIDVSTQAADGAD